MNGDWLLPEFIATFVPLEIMSMEQRGGPTPLEWAEARDYWQKQLDQGRHDELVYREKGTTAKTAGMLVRLIACMAFQPGGIKVFDHHFVAYDVEIALFPGGIYFMSGYYNYQYPPEIDVVARRDQAAKRRAALVAAGCSTYILGGRGTMEAIQCLCCGLGSTAPGDVTNKYCGFCHQFHSEWIEQP